MESRGQEKHPLPAWGKDSLCTADDEDGKESTVRGPGAPTSRQFPEEMLENYYCIVGRWRMGGMTHPSERREGLW